MPRRRSQSTVRGLILGIVAVVIGIGLVLAVSVFASRSDLKNLGDQVFKAGEAKSKAEKIAEDGPLLFSDPSGGKDLDVYLQHVDGKWFTIAAGDRDCTLRWSKEDERFIEPCTGDTFPADGAGRTRYRTVEKDGELLVDFTETVP
jgi:hypothetical protein